MVLHLAISNGMLLFHISFLYHPTWQHPSFGEQELSAAADLEEHENQSCSYSGQNYWLE
jgi:hypothetical protein